MAEYPSFSTLHLNAKGRALLVSIDNPPANVMDRAMIRDLRLLLQLASADPDVRCLVFDSRNAEFFISHLDLNIVAKGLPEAPPRPEKLSSLQALFEGFRKLDKPTIGVLCGRVNGAGTEFALSLDMRFAAIGRTWIGQFEVALGLLPGATGTQRLREVAGRARALELILGCDELDAETAEKYGLVNRALPPDGLASFVDALVARIASFPPEAVRLAKRAVDFSPSGTLEALLEEGHLAGQLMATDEAKRRFEAILAMGAQTPQFEKELARRLIELERPSDEFSKK
jgi:enoyl-CoA hydratase/carnithine racemase